jgi:hypothetical protein
MKKPKQLANSNDEVLSQDVHVEVISEKEQKKILKEKLEELKEREAKKSTLSKKELLQLESDKKALQIEVKKLKEKKLYEEDDIIAKVAAIYNDKKIRFAKANWGVGKGPYILAFEGSSDFEYCSCNAYEFREMKPSEVKQNFVHIWECGMKTPEQINSLPTIDMKKQFNSKKEKKVK